MNLAPYQRRPPFCGDFNAELTLGERIMRLRIGLGMSQIELAQKAKIARANLCRIERDQTNKMTVQTLRRLATALGVYCGALLD